MNGTSSPRRKHGGHLSTQSDGSQVMTCENCGKRGAPPELMRFEWEAVRKMIQEYGDAYSTTKTISWFPVVPRVVIAVTLCKECIQREADRLSTRGWIFISTILGVLATLMVIFGFLTPPSLIRAVGASFGVLVLSGILAFWIALSRSRKKPQLRGDLWWRAVRLHVGQVLEPYCRRKLVEGGYDLGLAIGSPGHTHVTRNPHDEVPQSAVSPVA